MVIRENLKKFLPGFFTITGSFIITAGWSWYHFNKHDLAGLVLKGGSIWVSVTFLLYVLKKIYLNFAGKYNINDFWIKVFGRNLEELYFLCSLLFLIFFIEIEWITLLYVALLLPVVFIFIQKMFSRHPDSSRWLLVNKALFYFGYFIFLVEMILQFFAYKFYIFDNNVRFYNIVLFRTVAMTLFWLCGFAVVNLLFLKAKNYLRFVPITIWALFYVVVKSLWVLNLGVLYFSGLYLSPVAVQHAEGAGKVLQNDLTYLLVPLLLVVTGVFIYILCRSVKVWDKEGKNIFPYFGVPMILAFVAVVLTITSFRNTPEVVIAKSFYESYYGVNSKVILSPEVQKKLEKFGLKYEPGEFFVNTRENTFTPTSTRFLPNKFIDKQPNVVLVFLESFSSRLSDVYGSKFKNVTPNLKDFAENINTTVFHNFFNASTPTITGSLSQLCSFLTPTGHNEIQEERKLQSHRLLCLPEILKDKAGFKYSSYITAVEKNYANKDGIFLSMGVDKVFGTEELKKHIYGKPLSWGFSDHQLFPALWNFMHSAPEPFLLMMATNDTHPPFDLPKDAVNYGDGKRPVLNMFHSTDDAFGKFWSEFQGSRFAENTIIIAVADHAIFPGALTKDLFPEEAKNLSFYDQNFLAIYIPDNVLPKEIRTYSSGIDLLPTVLQIFNINIPNSFEGHSILSDREKYPNLLGMHELGLYINQKNGSTRNAQYEIPTNISCAKDHDFANTTELTLCDYKHFYEWKRQMFEEGRFWKH